jgi:cytochrome c553
MRAMKLALPAAILMTGFLICTSATYGKAEYSKKEKQACGYCHVKMGAKELNDTGKCYQANDHSLATCKAPEKK